MVWDMVNRKITKKIVWKNIKVGWNDDKNAKKCQKLIFFDFFILLRFWRKRCFITVRGVLNTKITKKKFKNILRGGKTTTKNTFLHQKTFFLWQFFSQMTFSLRFWWPYYLLMVWNLLNTKTAKKKLKKYFLVWKCNFWPRFSATKDFQKKIFHRFSWSAYPKP